eukprot:13487637-Heterocapsa_arctica.AAC.1
MIDTVGDEVKQPTIETFTLAKHRLFWEEEIIVPQLPRGEGGQLGSRRSQHLEGETLEERQLRLVGEEEITDSTRTAVGVGRSSGSTSTGTYGDRTNPSMSGGRSF